MENLVSPTSIIQTFCLVPAGSDNQGWTTTLSEYTLEVEVSLLGQLASCMLIVIVNVFFMVSCVWTCFYNMWVQCVEMHGHNC